MLQKVSGSDKEYRLLQPKDLTPENLPVDVHTWKWYFACGQRYLVVGTGVSARVCTSINTDACTYSTHAHRHTYMYVRIDAYSLKTRIIHTQKT